MNRATLLHPLYEVSARRVAYRLRRLLFCSECEKKRILQRLFCDPVFVVVVMLQVVSNIPHPRHISLSCAVRNSPGCRFDKDKRLRGVGEAQLSTKNIF